MSPTAHATRPRPPLGAALLLILCLISPGARAQEGAASTPATTATTPISLEALREEARKLADAGGDEAPDALMRWELLARVLDDPQPPEGAGPEELQGEVNAAEARLRELEANPDLPADPQRVQELSERISRNQDLIGEWLGHQSSVQLELQGFQEELRHLDEDPDGTGDGAIPLELKRRALSEGVSRFEAHAAEAGKGVELLRRLGGHLGEEYKLLRAREAVGEADLQRKEAELAELEAAIRRRAERAAELLRRAVDAEKKASEAQERLEAELLKARDETSQRVNRLKIDREEERKELALERGSLARAEQELEEARAARKRDEIRVLAQRKVLDEGFQEPAQVREMLRLAEGDLRGIEVELRLQNGRLQRARGLLDRLRTVRRGYRQREEDLLAPDLPKNLRGSAWVLRTILSTLDDREQVAEELRDRRDEVVQELEFRRRDQEAWVETLREALPDDLSDLLESRRRPRFRPFVRFLRDLGRGIRAGVPLRLVRQVGARVVAALRGESVAPLGSATLMALLLFLLLVRLLRLVEDARLQAELQADAFDAAQARAERGEPGGLVSEPPRDPMRRTEPGRRPDTVPPRRPEGGDE